MRYVVILVLSLFFVINPVFAGIGIDSSDWKKNLKPELTKEEKAVQAIKSLKRKLEKDPENYEHYFSLAFFYDHLDLYEKEGEALQNEIKYYPEGEEGKDAAYGNLARVYLILGNLDQAKAALDKAMQINPENPANQRHLVEYYLRKDKFKKAALVLKKLSKMNPDGDQYYNFYKYGIFKLGIPNSELIAFFKQALNVNPNNYEAHKIYATALRNDFKNLEKNFPLIVKEYKKAINLKPKDVFNYISIANAYMLKAKTTKDDKYYQNSLQWLKKAKQIDPKNKKLPYAFGYCYLTMEKYTKAIEYLEEAVRIHPNQEQPLEILLHAYNGKAYQAYKKGENLEEGIKAIDKALTYQPENGVLLSTKAELLYKMGRYEEAYKYIKQAIALEPDYLEIQQDLKMIEEVLGKQNN